MSEFDHAQRSRIRAAKALIETFEQHRNADDLGDLLVEAYMSTGKGDGYDITSTIIDCMSDLGFAIGSRGDNFGAIAAEVRRGEASSIEAELMLALKEAYREDLPGYEETHAFDDLVRIALDHNGFEMENRDAADYGEHAFR
jgi:hypothetical protein